MKYPEWVLKHKRKGAAIHKIRGNYYLYEITSIWDKGLKRARKITKKYLGVITPKGLKEPDYRHNLPTTCKEYGAISLILRQNQDILKGLKMCFPYWWKELFILSVFRLIKRAPLKHMQLHYQDSFISEKIKGVRLHKNAIRSLLGEIGANRESIIKFLKLFIFEGENLLIDLTHVFSLSENIILAEKGYNNEFNWTPQVNVLFMFSFDKKVPLFYRVLPGSVRDVKTLKATITESGLKDVIIVGDKGFYSVENAELLKNERLRYIFPLKRNNSLIDYTLLKKEGKEGFEGYFKFKKRHIWYYRSMISDLPVWVFLDEHLRVREEEDYLSRIETHPEKGYRIEGFKEKLGRFGTVALITNLVDLSPERVFQYYKSRVQIEKMFDIFKNLLQADRTYMRTDKAMETWMFINYIALIYYYKIYHLLIENELLKQYSPLDVIIYLSKVRKVKVSTHWIDLEIPKQVRTLIEKLNIPIT